MQERGQPDVDELDESTVDGTGADQQARLQHAEGDRDVGADGSALDGAGVRVDAGREVDGDERRMGAVGRQCG